MYLIYANPVSSMLFDENCLNVPYISSSKVAEVCDDVYFPIITHGLSMAWMLCYARIRVFLQRLLSAGRVVTKTRTCGICIAFRELLGNLTPSWIFFCLNPASVKGGG